MDIDKVKEAVKIIVKYKEDHSAIDMELKKEWEILLTLATQIIEVSEVGLSKVKCFCNASNGYLCPACYRNAAIDDFVLWLVDRMNGLKSVALRTIEDFSPSCLAFDTHYREDKYDVISGVISTNIRNHILGREK